MPDDPSLAARLRDAVVAPARPAVAAALDEPAIAAELRRVTDPAEADRVVALVARRVAGLAPEHVASTVRSVLAAVLCEQVERDVLRLAVRRFLTDHPHRVAAAAPWLDALELSARQAGTAPSSEELDDAARRVREMAGAGAAPTPSGRLAAEAARSGSFDATAGALADFLVSVGHPTRTLELE
jgi:hypothetical protein